MRGKIITPPFFILVKIIMDSLLSNSKTKKYLAKYQGYFPLNLQSPYNNHFISFLFAKYLLSIMALPLNKQVRILNN